MKETNNQHLNSSESNRKKSFSQKTKDFMKNTTDAVKKTLASTAVAVSTLIPASVESLTTIAPTAAKVVAVPTAAALVTACHDDLDTTPPRIDIVQKNLEIQWWETLRISGNQVYVWNTLIFRCSDDISSSINIYATFNWKAISSWYTFNESGTLSIKASDESGNTSNASSQINKKEVADDIKCSLHKSEVSISKWDKITKNGKEIFVWSEKIFAWDNDDYTFSIDFGDNKNIQLPYTLENSGDITFTLTNKWKSETWTTKVTIDEVDNNKSPEITRKYPEDKTPNILWWVTVNMKNNQLLFWNTVMYEWKDDNTETCTPSLNIKWNTTEIKTWETIKEWGTLSYTLTDEKWKSTSVEFSIESKGIDITNLSNLNMQVDQETDLLQWISIPSGIQISKVEVEVNWQRQEIKGNNGHYLYTPTQPWTCYIYITEKWEFWNTYVEKSKNPLTIKDIEYPEYQSISINNAKPVDILPIIWQIEAWDKNVYSHIEHLRVAETTKIRDMMRKYGTGKYSPEKYQELMSRLNTGMTLETPKWYDNYEIIWDLSDENPSEHAHTEWSIIVELLNHANLKIINPSGNNGNRFDISIDFINKHPNSINIFWNSSFREADKSYYTSFNKNIFDLWNSKNFILFIAWTNIKNPSTWTINKIYNGDYDADEHGIYSLASFSNSNKNTRPNCHFLVTIATNKNGDINQTWITQESSKFPVWFSNNVLFSWRWFPEHTEGVIYWPSWRYTTSDTNYFNVALTGLCFQMKADAEDADEVLDMIRSTALTDHIRFDLNGDWDTKDNIDGQIESQPLQLINPAGVFKKYCMITNIPSSIKAWEIITLTKSWYLWLVFDIPWAEVKINWQWVPYNKTNESLIKSQNPMNLEWRINSNEAMKYGKKNLKWKIIVVDDQWNGLNMDKEITINIQ